jgi:hypothetical protein
MHENNGSSHDHGQLAEKDSGFSQSRRLEAIGRLAGGVAHDFNNHLTVILSCSQMLRDRHREDEETRTLLAEIDKACQRGAMLTRQLLIFSRKQNLQPVVLNLNEVVNNLVTMLRRLIGENINLTTDVDPALSNIKADAGQIEQVIMNLVVNARDAMPRGGELRIETRQVVVGSSPRPVEVGIPPGSYVTLVVRDTGCGMDSEGSVACLSRSSPPRHPARERDWDWPRSTASSRSSTDTFAWQARRAPGHGSAFTCRRWRRPSARSSRRWASGQRPGAGKRSCWWKTTRRCGSWPFRCCR